ncbi:hypothetical protein J113_05460 [Mycobacterium tuberculosis CAS/NITR204]|uniref:Acyl-CoA:diacylglycerol acyltransferase n=1 Tax=Mycobacterium tuberculosis CAS/NITR204 TaxID=1310114 RepID=R4M616_MYCTX|nr:hypothetical protein J113_05460 [Mycobacterium tuberculosis CAS/NITR204]
MMARMPELSRRAVLGLGAGTVLGATSAYAIDMLLQPRTSHAAPAAAYAQKSIVADTSTVRPPRLRRRRRCCTASAVRTRAGKMTNWAIARPPGQTQALRPVIALHGLGGSASAVMDGGVEQGLAQAVNAGLPPFAVVSVDGGSSYWHQRASGEDAGAMVLNELIPLLDTQRLDTSRVAFLGWSMGGYGALLLGSRLGPARTAAICAVSPALWLSAGSVAPGSFDGPDDWSANSVFGLPALGSIPIRVDCGNSDPFYAATKQFVAQLPHPPAGGFSPGGHNGGFWSAQLPAELTWFAPLLTG